MLKSSASTNSRRSQLWTAFAIALAGACIMAAVAVSVPAFAAPAASQPAPAANEPAPAVASETAMAPLATLDRIKSTGKLVLGYRTDAPPLSYQESGKPAGYSVTLCQKVADAVKANLGVPTLAVEWTAVSADGGVSGVQQGTIDLLCGADIATQTQRAVVAFSIPVFPGGIAALLRKDGSQQLQSALDERPPPYAPTWRGSTPQSIKALQRRNFSVVGGTPVVDLLVTRMAELRINSTVAPVDSYAAGVAKVVDGSADVLFGDRAALLDVARRDAHAKDLHVLTRYFTFEPIAFALHRDDDAFRLVVDQSLSAVYATPAFGEIYAASFGPVDPDTVRFFRMTIVPK